MGNRTWRENPLATAAGQQYDERYLYDLLHRLKTMDRGTLNISKTGLTSTTFGQCWTLDETGNWKNFRQDDTGDGTWDLVQSRTSNTVNEITDITESAGPSWIAPIYSRSGNMTTMPQPGTPTSSYTATYDAWNRLVKIAAGSDTVSEYAYDGAKRRIVQKSYASGTLSETRHLYYTEPSQWQVIEERLGTSPDSASANRQFVWGERYIDDCVLRDRDTDGNGTLDERLYALQDANWNVTSLSNTSGTIQERFAYTAYGSPLFLTASFTSTSDAYAWESLYCGYRYEASTGLVHVRNRVLHVGLGCWIQRDPLGYIFHNCNLYDYVQLSAVSRRDPSGLAWIEVYVPAICYSTPHVPSPETCQDVDAYEDGLCDFECVCPPGTHGGYGFVRTYYGRDCGRPPKPFCKRRQYVPDPAPFNVFQWIYDSMSAAYDALRRNPALVIIGAVVIIAGVAYIVSTSGTGVVLLPYLVPAVAVA